VADARSTSWWSGDCAVYSSFFFFDWGTVLFHSRLGKCAADGGKRRIRYDFIRLHYVDLHVRVDSSTGSWRHRMIVGYRTSAVLKIRHKLRWRWVRQLWCRIGTTRIEAARGTIARLVRSAIDTIGDLGSGREAWFWVWETLWGALNRGIDGGG